MSAQRPGPRTDRETPEVVRLLATPGCVLCRTRDAVEDTWLRWFAIETHGDAETLSALHDSVGFCPAHTRRVVGLDNAAVVRRPWEFVLRSAIARAMALVDGQPPRPAAPCPACAVVMERVTAENRFLLERLDHAGVRQQLRDNAGLCVRHGGDAVASLEPEHVAVVADAVRAALAGDTPVEVVTGTDSDAGHRAGFVRLIANDVTTEDDLDLAPRDRLVVDLLAGTCPSCRARGRAEVRYLCWLTTHDDARAPVAQDTELCGVHLHDLVALAGVGSWAVGARRDAVRARVTRLADAAAALPARRGRLMAGRRRARDDDADGSAEREYAVARSNLVEGPRCRACAAGDTADERCRSLLSVGIGDARVRRALEESHGLCLHHAKTLPAPVAGPYRERLLTQLRLISWELDEDIRMQAWDTRHETRGREVTAWRRVPMLLDGMAYLGRADDRSHDGEAR